MKINYNFRPFPFLKKRQLLKIELIYDQFHLLTHPIGQLLIQCFITPLNKP